MGKEKLYIVNGKIIKATETKNKKKIGKIKKKKKKLRLKLNTGALKSKQHIQSRFVRK